MKALKNTFILILMLSSYQMNYSFDYNWSAYYGIIPNVVTRKTVEQGEVIYTYRILNDSPYRLKVWNAKDAAYSYQLNPGENLLFSGRGSCCEFLHYTCEGDFSSQKTFKSECKIKFELLTSSGKEQLDRFDCLELNSCGN